MDSGCVELLYTDGSILAIDTIAVENEYAEDMYQRSELDWLIYNDLLAYANLVLNGDATDTFDPDRCVSLLRGSLKRKSSDGVEAVSGFNMTAEQKERVRIIQGHFADIDRRIAQIDEVIANLTAGYEGAIALLCTVPGIDHRLAITIISEIGTDMSQFGSSKRLCRWAGLTPGNNESAGQKKSVKISRAGVYLKPALVEAAHAAVNPRRSSPTSGTSTNAS